MAVPRVQLDKQDKQDIPVPEDPPVQQDILALQALLQVRFQDPPVQQALQALLQDPPVQLVSEKEENSDPLVQLDKVEKVVRLVRLVRLDILDQLDILVLLESMV
jgi:hypothetical protein